MTKKLIASFLLLFVFGVIVGTKMPYGKQHSEPVRSSDANYDGPCPSLDELLIQEIPEASMKIEAPAKDLVLTSKNTVTQEDEADGVRIILRYDDREELLKKAHRYGLSTDKVSSQVPYCFTLSGTGEHLYFMNDSAFRKFLLDIGGRIVLGEAKKEIVVSLASGSRFELIEYE